MRDPLPFPLLPDDRRYVSRLDRYLSDEEPPADEPPEPVAGEPVQPSVLDRLPRWAAGPVGTAAAAVLLVFQLAYLLACRPDVRGRRVRRVLLTPADVRKALVVSRTVPAALRVLGRTFVRRVGAEARFRGKG